MWGNSLGWGISAAMVVTVVGSIAWLSHSLDTISAPTDFPAKYGVAEAIALPVEPKTLLPAEPGPSDPVSLYRQAIEMYQQDHMLFDHFAKSAMTGDPKKIEPAVALLRDAAGSTPTHIFANTPEEVVNYSNRPALAALFQLGNCALNLGLRTRPKDKSTATKDFEAAFCLGNRMYDERLNYQELSSGFGLMDGAAKMLAEDDGDSGRAQAFKDFEAASEQYSHDRIEPVQAVLSTVNPPDIDRHAGDIFWVAQNAKDRMWRVEAILSLGRYKYMAPRKGDNLGAQRVASEIAQNDADPIVKMAATLARDLTPEQYNMLH